MPLHEEHKLRISQVVRLGCDRATACAFAGTTLADLQRELDRDPAFRSELHRLEAEVGRGGMGDSVVGVRGQADCKGVKRGPAACLTLRQPRGRAVSGYFVPACLLGPAACVTSPAPTMPASFAGFGGGAR